MESKGTFKLAELDAAIVDTKHWDHIPYELYGIFSNLDDIVYIEHLMKRINPEATLFNDPYERVMEDGYGCRKLVWLTEKEADILEDELSCYNLRFRLEKE